MELLAKLWAVDHCKTYVYGVQFETISDHEALMSVLKLNRGNKTISSRLTRCVDRLLPFDFEVMADFISRHLKKLQEASVRAVTIWNECFTVNSVISLNDLLENGDTSSKQHKPTKNVNESNTVNRKNNATEKQQIRKRDKRNSSTIFCSNTSRTCKMSQVHQPSCLIKAVNG